MCAALIIYVSHSSLHCLLYVLFDSCSSAERTKVLRYSQKKMPNHADEGWISERASAAASIVYVCARFIFHLRV
jgi:hypothetical protein